MIERRQLLLKLPESERPWVELGSVDVSWAWELGWPDRREIPSGWGAGGFPVESVGKICV